jgi:DNA-binding transcriptional ArsR family regulator
MDGSKMTDNTTFISLDLSDSRIKQISEIIGNDTCKKILRLIAEEELTETDISVKLGIPLNTIDYNIKKLLNSGLIESTKHWWSVKGKKIPSYRLSNKKIIISPRSFSSQKAVVSLLVITGFAGFAIKKLIETIEGENISASIKAEFAQRADLSTAETSQCVGGASMNCGAGSAGSWLANLAGWEWFLIGAWFGIILFFLFIKLRERRLKK